MVLANNQERRGKRSPSGEVVLPGSERELTPSQRREILKQMASVIAIYAEAISSIMRPHDPTTFEDASQREQALIENEVVFEAVREKAAVYASLTQQLITESRGNHDNNQRALITRFFSMLREGLGTPNATDMEMKAAWENLYQTCQESKNKKELQMRLLGLFHLKPRKKDGVLKSEITVNSLKGLARYCRRTAMSLALGDTLKDSQHKDAYNQIAIMIERKPEEELLSQLEEIIPVVAQTLRHLNYEHPTIPTMSDEELLLIITTPNSSTSGIK